MANIQTPLDSIEILEDENRARSFSDSDLLMTFSNKGRTITLGSVLEFKNLIESDVVVVESALREYIESFAFKDNTSFVDTSKLPYSSDTQDGIITKEEHAKLGQSVGLDLDVPALSASSVVPSDSVLVDDDSEAAAALKKITFAELDRRWDQRETKVSDFKSPVVLRDGAAGARVDLGTDNYQSVSFDGQNVLPTDEDDPLFLHFFRTDNNDDTTFRVRLGDLKDGTPDAEAATALDWYILENAVDGRNVCLAKDPDHNDRLLFQLAGDSLRSARITISYAPHIKFLVSGLDIDTDAFKVSYTVRVGESETVVTKDLPKVNAATHTQPSRIIYDHTITRQGFYEEATDSVPFTNVSFPLDFIQSDTDKVELWHNVSQKNRLTARAAGDAATQSTGETVDGLNDEELSFAFTSDNKMLCAALDADGVGTRVRVEVREQTHFGPTPDALLADVVTNTSDTQFEFSIVGTLVAPKTGKADVWIQGVRQEAKLDLKSLDDLTDGTLNGDATTNNIEYDYDGSNYFNKVSGGQVLYGNDRNSGQSEILVRLEPDIPEGRTDADILRTVFTKLSESDEFSYDTNTGLVSVALTFADITGTLTSGQIGDRQVLAQHYGDASIPTRAYQNNSVMGANIAERTIEGDNLADGAINNTRILGGEVVGLSKLDNSLQTILSSLQARGAHFGVASRFPTTPEDGFWFILTEDGTTRDTAGNTIRFANLSNVRVSTGFAFDIFQYDHGAGLWRQRGNTYQFRPIPSAREGSTATFPVEKIIFGKAEDAEPSAAMNGRMVWKEGGLFAYQDSEEHEVAFHRDLGAGWNPVWERNMAFPTDTYPQYLIPGEEIGARTRADILLEYGATAQDSAGRHRIGFIIPDPGHRLTYYFDNDSDTSRRNKWLVQENGRGLSGYGGLEITVRKDGQLATQDAEVELEPVNDAHGNFTGRWLSDATPAQQRLLNAGGRVRVNIKSSTTEFPYLFVTPASENRKALGTQDFGRYANTRLIWASTRTFQSTVHGLSDNTWLPRTGSFIPNLLPLARIRRNSLLIWEAKLAGRINTDWVQALPMHSNQFLDLTKIGQGLPSSVTGRGHSDHSSLNVRPRFDYLHADASVHNYTTAANCIRLNFQDDALIWIGPFTDNYVDMSIDHVDVFDRGAGLRLHELGWGGSEG